MCTIFYNYLIVQVSLQPSSVTGYFSLYMSTMQSLVNEPHLQSSLRGHSVVALATYIIEQSDCSASVGFAEQLCTQIKKILEGSRTTNQKLPTAIMGRKVWGIFHKFRFNPQLQVMWTTYQTALHTPPSLQGEGKLLLQLLIDRVLKRFITAEALTLWTTVRCFSFAKSWNEKIAQESLRSIVLIKHYNIRTYDIMAYTIIIAITFMNNFTMVNVLMEHKHTLLGSNAN